MKAIIAGGRDRMITDFGFKSIDQFSLSEIVSCGASGIGHSGELYAEDRGILCTVFQADWKSYGRRAGPIRNSLMADYADMLIIFPGGRGTTSMVGQAKSRGLILIDWRESEEGFLWEYMK